MFDAYSIANSTVVEEEEEMEGKECSGVSERYNIPDHSAPVPKCTCCTCSYLHARDFRILPICTCFYLHARDVRIFPSSDLGYRRPGFCDIRYPKGELGNIR